MGADPVVALFLPACACLANGMFVATGGERADVHQAWFWESLPRPADAQPFEVADGSVSGFTTGMREPELFDFYAARLAERGWERQAPTEPRVTLPRQVWLRDGAELQIDIGGLTELGRTVVWLRLKSD